MKLFKTLSLLAVAAAAAALTATPGCSSDSGSSGTITAGKSPPPAPVGAAASDTPARTFAMNQLFLGETGRNGAALKDAWKDYGYDIDGLTTTKDSKDVCQRFTGADSSKQEDGTLGTDNAFGHTVLGFLLSLLPTPSKTINDSIQGGSFTILLDVKGLTDDAKQTNTGLNGRLLVGGGFLPAGTKPNFADPAIDWPYRATPIVPIEGGYITNGTFVNGAGGATIPLSLYIQGVALSLSINQARITFEHQPPNDITNGTISGVIDTEALVTGIEKVAGRLSTQLCKGSLLDTVKNTIRQASDILSDGTNRAGTPCTGISVGLGFTGKRVGSPKTIAVETPPPADPCTTPADGGTDGG